MFNNQNILIKKTVKIKVKIKIETTASCDIEKKYHQNNQLIYNTPIKNFKINNTKFNNIIIEFNSYKIIYD